MCHEPPSGHAALTRALLLRCRANCYHAYPAGAAFGGYKESGIGRETHKTALGAYQQVKNTLVSYCPNALGFF